MPKPLHLFTPALLASLGVLAAACTSSTSDPPTAPDAGPVGCIEEVTDCSAPLELKNADIQGGKTLTAKTCYRVSEDLNLSSGTLSAPEGVVIQFATGKSISVKSGGQLKLAGTCPAPVKLTSQEAAGSWKGVQLDDSQGADNDWTYAVVERAGSAKWTGAADTEASVYLSGATTLKMDHVTIRESKAHGLYATEKVDFSFTAGTFEKNVTPAYLHPQVADRIPADVTLKENTNPYFRVVFGNADSVEGAHTWQAHVFRIEDRFFVKGDLTILPGAKLEFAQGKSVLVEAGGTLTAKGTAERKVTFAGAASTKGFWQGIQIKSGGIGSPPTIGATFDHAVISDAGGAAWTGDGRTKAAVFMFDTSAASITNTTFRGNESYGLWAGEKSQIPGFAANTFTGNGRAMYVYPDRVGEMAATSTLTGNDEDGIFVSFGNTDRVNVPQTWKDPGVPYNVMDRFFVEAALTIDAGVVLRFSQGHEMIVTDKGSLTVNGTAAKPVTFKGQNEIATGYWKGIQIQSNSDKNVIAFATIAHAGSNTFTGAPESDGGIYIDDKARLSLNTVTVGPGGGYGIVLGGVDSVLGCSTVTFGALVKGPVWQSQPGPGTLLQTCP